MHNSLYRRLTLLPGTLRQSKPLGETALRAAIVGMSICAVQPASAFESDVHFGLTLWLALRAGFDSSHAQSIAVADQRVDGGSMETQMLGLEYACAGHDDRAARDFQSSDFPSETPVPAPTGRRTVAAGSGAARSALDSLAKQWAGKEGLLTGKLGEALHSLQDSWAHQGEPSVPDFGAALKCDPLLYSGAPAARGGPLSHLSSRTDHWIADTVAMARASYAVLTSYPAVDGRIRQPAPWQELEPFVKTFAKADTKTRKRVWFVNQGISDTSFLQASSLPEGPSPGLLHWDGWQFPALERDASIQHDAPADVRLFLDRFFKQWLGGERVENLVAEFGPGRSSSARALSSKTFRDPAIPELIARLKLWKLRDHGLVAKLIHSQSAYTSAEFLKINQLVQDDRASIRVPHFRDALFPLLPLAPYATPMVPYIVKRLPDANNQERVLAILRFRHAPYDTVGLLVVRTEKGWELERVLAAVDP